MSDDDLFEAQKARGEAFAHRWLVPLIPAMHQLEVRGDVEWAIPARLWHPDFAGARFYGLPLMLDDEIDAPAPRLAAPSVRVTRP